jgi:hypothetical protein
MAKTDASFIPDQYATVAERIELFYSRFPQGRINTELVTRAEGEITFKALVYRVAEDAFPAATGWASEREGDGDINTVACLENTETSAVGRALANLGFTASSKRPSREEMEKAARVRSSLLHRHTKREDAAGLPSSEREAAVQLHSQADAADDVLQLISRAENRGLPMRRANLLRERVNKYPGLPPSRVRKIEALLRVWIRRREL